MTLLSKSLLLVLCVTMLGALALSGETGERSKTARDDAAEVEQQEPAVPAPEPANRETTSGRPTPPTSASATVVHASRDAEQVIRRAMQKKITVDFVDTPLDEAMQFLTEEGGYPVWINETALDEEGIATDEPINDMLEDVTIEQALNWTLRPLGMTWVIEDELLKVTTEIDAKWRTFTRTYDIQKLLDLGRRRAKEQDLKGDFSVGEISSRTYATRQTRPLAAGLDVEDARGVFSPVSSAFRNPVFPKKPGFSPPPATVLFQFGSGVGVGRGLGGPSTDDDHEWLFSLIQETTSGPWPDDGGSTGTMSIMNNVLVVRQTQKVHEEVASLLQALEAVGDGHAKQGRIAALPETYPHKEDAAIRVALANKSTANYVDVPLSSVAGDIAGRYKIRVRIDKIPLDEEGITIDEPVTLTVKDIALNSTLYLILEPLGLTAYVSEGALWITTSIDAEERLFTAVYVVRDLVESDDDYSELAELIMGQTSGPWEESTGSGGSLVTAEPVGAIVVRQTEKVHQEVARLLADMRKTIAQQPKTKKPSDDPQEVITRVYHLQGNKLVDDLLTAIPRFVAPETWGDNNDAGIIQKVDASLVIRQQRRVHQQIIRFLQGFGFSPNIGVGTGQFQIRNERPATP